MTSKNGPDGNGNGHADHAGTSGSWVLMAIPMGRPAQTYIQQGTRLSPFTFLSGPGADDRPCRACGFELCAGMEPGMIQGIAFVCPRCRTPNAVNYMPIGDDPDLPRLDPTMKMDSVTYGTEAFAAVLARVGPRGARIACRAGVATVSSPLKVRPKTRILGSSPSSPAKFG